MNNENQARVAIIGGGIMGISLAYLLAKETNLSISIFERGNHWGGLAACMDYDGARLDRFYHTILSSDMSMQSLIREAGVEDKLHFTETKQGFYDNGKLYPFSSPVDLMTYPPLNIVQRFRLGLQIVYAQLESDWRHMDNIPVETWLKRVSGAGVYEKVWQPLLRSKFDTTFKDVPATYIWSRLKRMMGTRQGVTSKEMMCYLENGYYTLIEALAALCVQRGVAMHLNTAIDEIVIQDGRAVGIQTPDGFQPYDAVISTLASPILSNLLPAAPPDLRSLLNKQEYLSVLCPLLILKRSLIPYYVLNITDASIPFTGVVETTNLIDPKHVKGHHLVYLPKYLAPDNEMAQWPDERVKTEWMGHLKRMFPDFDESWITDFIVQRARYVEPIRPLGTSDQIPEMRSGVERLYMGNTTMIYPELGNGEAVTNFSRKLAQAIIEDHVTWTAQPALALEQV
jgi:protoporphyrinogen oxidase